MKKAYLLILFLTYSVLSMCEIVTYDEDNYYVDTNNYNLVISKENGMIISAKLSEIDFELVSDYPNYTLFFSEFGPEDTLSTASNHLFFFSPQGATEFTTSVEINTDLIAVITFDWNTEYIRTKWEYKFIMDKPYFIADVEREVNQSYVYSNAQQCVMYSLEFDDTYIVDYTGNLHCTMSNNSNTYPTSATSQHSMFSAIDEGLSELFPMMGWHDDDYNIIAGIISSSVTPNQRKTISYHGGGASNEHPGFSEGQWNWFGKSDSESIFLKKGIIYGIQFYYFLDSGDINDLVEFNQSLFNENSYESKNTDNYFAASLGGRSYPLENYFWRFPQVSSDYICSQELFKHRSFAIPCSQNGTRDTHIFNIFMKQKSFGNYYDLTPIYGIDPLFTEAETIDNIDHMIGSMSWVINSVKHELNYKVFEGSDKVQVSGEVLILEETSMRELFVEFELSPRVNEVASIGDSIYDIRCNDEVYGKIGIAVYDLQNIEGIVVDENRIELYLIRNLSDSLYIKGSSFEYNFTLFPHVGYNVESSNEITPLLSVPENLYRDYYVTLPDQLGNNKYGICSNSEIFPYNTDVGYDSLLITLDLYCNLGTYPVNIFINEPEIKSVLINGNKISDWSYNEATNILVLEKDWNQGNYRIEIFDVDIEVLKPEILLDIFPNPFNIGTNISFELSQEAKYIITIYNIKGQLVRDFEGISSKHSIFWNGKDYNNYDVASGIYFCELATSNSKKRKKMILLK